MIAFITSSPNLIPFFGSAADAKRFPFNIAISLSGVDWLLSDVNKVDGLTLIPKSPKINDIVSVNVLLPLLPVPYKI